MKVIDPGHEYQLQVIDAPEKIFELVFVKREGLGYPGNVGHHPGTNCQEVLRAVADRLRYVNNQIRDDDNFAAIQDVEHAIFLLERRAARRHGRSVPMIADAVFGATCRKCGHIGCKGDCHQ